MRRVALILAILCTSAAQANNLKWKDAKVTRISSRVENKGVFVDSVGTAIVGGRIKNRAMYYWIETEDITYVLEYSYNPTVKLPWPGQHSRSRTPNVTLNGKTKIAIDGHNAHILDDDGRNVKVPIFEKIARQQPPTESPSK